MGIEIEKKFLLLNDSWREKATGVSYLQGYLANEAGLTVRVRIAGPRAYLTVKGPSQGAGRLEYEYQIPVEDAESMLRSLCRKSLIEKTRYTLDHGGFTWEIDVFHGDNQGLTVAEIELETEDQEFAKPPWVGDEVTGDSRYYNARLVDHPFKHW